MAIAATILGVLYKLRLRHATNQVRARLLERLHERERIAQDLHDTFFQSIQVLMLRFHTLTKQLPAGSAARGSYENALKQSEQVMIEGRELLIELRSEPSHDTPLHLALWQWIEDLRASTPARLTLDIAGVPRELNAGAGSEATKIAREAVANAIRHAGASHIDVLLAYEESQLRIAVRDDGCGIPAEVLEDGHREGHLGMPGMSTRARQVGARIEIRSNASEGTLVELILPAGSAYPPEKPAGKRTPYFYQFRFRRTP